MERALLLALASVLVLAPAADASGIVQSGNLMLGVRDMADLNADAALPSLGPCAPLATCSATTMCAPQASAALGMPCDNVLGMRWNGFEAIADNCRCEGWGVMYWDANGLHHGFAQSGLSPAQSGLQFRSFTASPGGNQAVSVVQMDALKITHDTHPYPGMRDTIETTVTVQNTGLVPISDVRYRRVTDFDTEPTPAHETVGDFSARDCNPPGLLMCLPTPIPPPELLCSTLDPFVTADPSEPFGFLPLTRAGWGTGTGAGNGPYQFPVGTPGCQGAFSAYNNPNGPNPATRQDAGFTFDVLARPFIDPPPCGNVCVPNPFLPFPPWNNFAPGYRQGNPMAPLGELGPQEAWRFKLLYHAGPDAGTVFNDMRSLNLGFFGIAFPSTPADQNLGVSILTPNQPQLPPALPAVPNVVFQSGIPVNPLQGPYTIQGPYNGVMNSNLATAIAAGIVQPPGFVDVCPLEQGGSSSTVHLPGATTVLPLVGQTPSVNINGLPATPRGPATTCQRAMPIGTPALYPGAYAIGYKFEPCAPGVDAECSPCNAATLDPVCTPCVDGSEFFPCNPTADFTYSQDLTCVDSPAVAPPPVTFTFTGSDYTGTFPAPYSPSTLTLPVASYLWTASTADTGTTNPWTNQFPYATQTPPMPGFYQVTLQVSTAPYYGNTFTDSITKTIEVLMPPTCPGGGGGSVDGTSFGDGSPRDRAGGKSAEGRKDLDGDGVIDAEDNCPSIANGAGAGESNQADYDRDGMGDACDPDADGDGVPDFRDNCLLAGNSRQSDIDGDGIGDACDPDIDGDGILNAADNCVVVPNADQLNIDGDALGNACDPDRDGDGVANFRDCFPEDKALVCPTGSAPADLRSRPRTLSAVAVADGRFMTAGGYAFLMAGLASMLLLAIVVARRRQ